MEQQTQGTKRNFAGRYASGFKASVHNNSIAYGFSIMITAAPAVISAGGEEASEETVTATDAPASLNYVALGDSLAVGTGAHYRGYVDRYAYHLEAETGIPVSVINLGRDGQTSSELLYALRHDASWRRAVGAADVITFNIGFNDLGHAGEAYEDGTCGGADDQECLRAAVQTFKENWDAIIAELLSLSSTDDTVIRTIGMGHTPRIFVDDAANTWPSEGKIEDLRILKPYVEEVNEHIATTAADKDVPYVEVYLQKGHVNPDGVHPNDEGYRVIAEQLRELGYEPLK